MTATTDTDCFAGLWQEYEQGMTAEAQLVRDADRLDMVMQAQSMRRAEMHRSTNSGRATLELRPVRQLFDYLRLGDRSGSGVGTW